jgi:hypothetical protein
MRGVPEVVDYEHRRGAYRPKIVLRADVTRTPGRADRPNRIPWSALPSPCSRQDAFVLSSPYTFESQMREKKSTHFLSLDSASMVVERERKRQEAEQPTPRQCWVCSEELGKSNRLCRLSPSRIVNANPGRSLCCSLTVNCGKPRLHDAFRFRQSIADGIAVRER